MFFTGNYVPGLQFLEIAGDMESEIDAHPTFPMLERQQSGGVRISWGHRGGQGYINHAMKPLPTNAPRN